MKKMLLFVFLCFSLTAFAEPIEVNESMVKETVSALMKKHHIPGVAVAIYTNGKPTTYYFGYADLEKKKPITKQTIFELGSLSKIFTSLLFTQAVDNEKLQLNTPVSKYLPRLDTHLSLQDLATHTAGLPSTLPKAIATRSQLDQYLEGLRPNTDRSERVYSNLGVGLLGFALEAETQTDLDTLYRKQILQPLGMRPIGLTVPKNLERFYAQGYDQQGRKVSHINAELLGGAYAIKASADDMKRFLGAAVGLETTPWSITFPMRLTQSTYVKLSNANQGLAWLIHPLTSETMSTLLREVHKVEFTPVRIKERLPAPIYNGNALIDKTGGTDGFRSYIAVVPNKKLGIVLLANKSLPDNSLAITGREILFRMVKDQNNAVKS